MSDGATIEKLRLALHGVFSPFSCGGTFAPDRPVSLVFKDRTRIEVVLAENVHQQTGVLKPLLEHCKPAPFGAGKKTRYDRTVRDAVQLKAENGGFAVENFDPESAGVLKEIQRELVPYDPNPITAELYTVNVYMDGGHFAPHKDTPRGSDMFGTLVVCLPSRFGSGALVLTHRGAATRCDWAEAVRRQNNPTQLHWAAFFGDVDHQIKRVRSGARVTLTYLLRRGSDGAVQSRDVAGEEHAPRIQEAWRASLADPAFFPEGGTLGYPCCHLYHRDARFQQKQSPITLESVAMLKGRDHLAAASALQAGLKVTFHPYMFENCADETWQLDRFPTQEEKSRLRSQMDEIRLKNSLPIRASSEEEGDFGVRWLEPPPSDDPSRFSKKTVEDGESAAAAHLHSCEYSPWGYFGNEGSEIDLYTYAALHIQVPPFGKGPRRAVNKTPKRTAAKRERTTHKRKTTKE